MSRESQNVEWKASWRDEYLRWVCGFANAQGGRLVIGKDDQGRTVGAGNARKLLEELPNKIRDLLGIVAEVNLVEDGDQELLEIKVEPYTTPISYRGGYYLRSGSTLQELKGAALDRFLMRKHGRTWDDAPLPQLALSDLSEPAVNTFRKLAALSGRLDETILKEPTPQLINKLRLTEGKYLKRGAALLFTADPEDYILGAFVKIGFFRSDTDLAYHDEIRGDLFSQVRQTVDLLRLKYMKAAISYVGIQRMETYPVPAAALREAVLNALIHKDYSIHSPIQIRVYADRLKIWNPGELPENWTLADLLGEHSSIPYNPLVANAFFRAGEIEAWGRGIKRIFEACRAAGANDPVIRYQTRDMWLEFPYDEKYLAFFDNQLLEKTAETRIETPVKTPVKTPVETKVKTPEQILQVLAENPSLTLADVAMAIGKSQSAVERASSKLVQAGRLKYVGPQKTGHWEVLTP
jgi:ATP-dependent DNA helicase RecG